MLQTLAISGYRSVRDLRLPLTRLNIVTGPNGSGKSSLYRAIRLLADIAQGNVISSLASEGGLASTLWAGPERFSRDMLAGRQPVEGTRRKAPIALKLGFADADYGYAIDLGLPIPSSTAFSQDPEIKCEALWVGARLKRGGLMASRDGPVVKVRSDAGQLNIILQGLPTFDSMMTHVADPSAAPEILQMRERMRGWRFYDHFRTDPESPIRSPQVGTRTPVLASNGQDLAAALQTIKEIGDAARLAEAIEDAFPGAQVDISDAEGRFSVVMSQTGLLRELSVGELSDGTVRYLCLVAALLSPRPPTLMVLNEPETSLHPSLLQPLARLISQASETTQIIIVSHAEPLVDALCKQPEASLFSLSKTLGETRIEDLDEPQWTWPQR